MEHTTQPTAPSPGASGLTNAGASLLYALRRYRITVTTAVFAAAVAGALLSLAATPVYEGVARLHLEDQGATTVFESSRPAPDPSRHARNQAALITSDPVLAAAASDITLEALRERVSAAASTSLDVIEVRALAATPSAAAELANAVADAYRDTVTADVQRSAATAVTELEAATAALQEQVDAAEQALAAEPGNPALQARRDAAVAQLITVQGRAEQIAVDAALHGDGVGLFQPALEPTGPVGPGPALTGIAGALVGLLAAAAVAWLVAERHQRADHRGDAAAVLDAPLLGDVPDFPRRDGAATPALADASSTAAEAYQFLVASLDSALTEAGGRSVLVTSPTAGDGKTVTALNLAMAAASDGRRVIVVDGDDRARGLSEATGAVDALGLTDLTATDGDLAGKALALPTGGGHALRLVPAGQPVTDPAGFYRSPAFRRAMSVIRDDAELVLVDSAPLLAVADTSAIASQVDGVVLVIARGTPLRAIAETKARLDLIGAPLLGYVFNRDVERGDGYRDRAAAAAPARTLVRRAR